MEYSYPDRSASTLESVERRTLTLELTGLRSREGVVYAALFSSAEGFPSDPSRAVRSGTFSIAELPLTIVFPDLPLGRYAATVHHDENMDGELNCNALGIPREGIGFSGNPRIWKGVPPYARAEFEFTSDATVVAITMKYLLP